MNKKVKESASRCGKTINKSFFKDVLKVYLIKRGYSFEEISYEPKKLNNENRSNNTRQ